MTTTTLDKIPLNSSYKIVSIDCEKPLQRRLYDLGLIENTPIKAIFKSPFGDPRAYAVRGYTIALRTEDASLIVVTKI